MGGRLTVAVRFPDRSVEARDVWTNATPNTFQDPRWLSCDRNFISDYFHRAGKASPLVPTEYGIIVWDFAEGQVIDNNMYSNYDIITAGSLGISPEARVNFERLAQARMLRREITIYTDGRSITDVSDILHPDTALACLAHSGYYKPFEANSVIYRIELPLKYTRLRGGDAPFHFRHHRLCYDMLTKLGFELTEYEHARWQSEIGRERDEYYR
jgi:hypothetical protein